MRSTGPLIKIEGLGVKSALDSLGDVNASRADPIGTP